MLLDPLRRYLTEVEQAVVQLGGVYIERYEEEILSPNRINLRRVGYRIYGVII